MARRSGGKDGYKYARKHIEDAERLSRELGDTDRDVKKYFFALPPHELNVILIAYGKQFGDVAEVYARDAMPRWKSGKVKMSGTVAERLFKLLPPRMPIGEKYKLTEGLWTHFGPSSKKRLRIGLTADLNEVVAKVDKHINEVVMAYKIPAGMEARFHWLSAGDVEVKQHLLNHIRGLERKLVSDAARLQLPVMVEHLKSNVGVLTHRMAQTLKVGKHELELLIDRGFEGAALEEWKPNSTPSRPSTSGNCFIATAVYGVDAPETNALRSWRDRQLMPTLLGRTFIATYYRISPSIVPILQDHFWLRRFVKFALDRFVGLIKN